MSKDGKKRGEVKDEELRGVSGGGLKEVTPVKGGKTDPTKPATRPGINPAPQKPGK